jgi:hypothetical protein
MAQRLNSAANILLAKQAIKAFDTRIGFQRNTATKGLGRGAPHTKRRRAAEEVSDW